MKTQAANIYESPSVNKNHDEMVKNRHNHLYKPLGIVAASIAAAGLAFGGVKTLEHFNSSEVVGTTQVDLTPNPRGDIDTIQRAVDEISDSNTISGITYEGQTIANELEKASDGSSSITVSVHENNWPGALKKTWVVATPTSEVENK